MLKCTLDYLETNLLKWHNIFETPTEFVSYVLDKILIF